MCTIEDVQNDNATLADNSFGFVTPSEITSLTGCLKPCSYSNLELIKETHFKTINATESQLMYFFSGKYSEEYNEFLAFDGYNLLGELGGVLGLFLGWSCYNGGDRLINWLHERNT